MTTKTTLYNETATADPTTTEVVSTTSSAFSIARVFGALAFAYVGPMWSVGNLPPSRCHEEWDRRRDVEILR